MRFTILLLFSLVQFSGWAQNSSYDIAGNKASADRKSILESIKIRVKSDLKLRPTLLVKHLYLKNGFAFFAGEVKNSNGGDINWSKTVYKEANEEGAFDGPTTHALLKKSGEGWKVLAYAIGATDVPFGCWWKEFKAPKDIFTYVEKTCDY